MNQSIPLVAKHYLVTRPKIQCLIRKTKLESIYITVMGVNLDAPKRTGKSRTDAHEAHCFQTHVLSVASDEFKWAWKQWTRLKVHRDRFSMGVYGLKCEQFSLWMHWREQV